MPRRLRCAEAGYVYHVLNRAVGRATLVAPDPSDPGRSTFSLAGE